MDVIPQKIEALDRTIETLKKMIRACKEMQNGVSENVVCRSLDLDIHKLQTLIREDWTYKTNDLNFSKTKCARGFWINWRDFFCYILYGETIRPLEDFDSSYEIALSGLTNREKDVIVKYFEEGLSFAEIAQIRGVTKGTIIACFHTACKKLKKAEVSDYFRYGQEVVKERDANLRLKKQKEELEKMLSTLKRENETLKSDIEDLSTSLKSSNSLKEHNFPIDGITNMSHRLYNVLKRNGVEYLDEVLYHGKHWFLSMNGFGNVLMEELELLADKYNLKFGGNL